MEKQLKIYLQYPWKFPDSPYYKYLLSDFPKEVKYLNLESQKGVIIKKRKFKLSNKLKKVIRKLMRIFSPSILNSHKSPKGDYDLIHCAHCLSENEEQSWIADFESFWQLWVSTKKTKKGLKKVEKVLKQKNCKKILPWTKKVEKEFLEHFPFLREKIELVYPAIPEKKQFKKRGKKIRIIFSGRYFFQKGGLHALEAINFLTKKYSNIEAIINSEIPKEIFKRYSKNKKIKFYPLIPQKKLFELYRCSDILIYPGYTDSFGFAYLESMSFGVPIVTVDGDSRKEIVEEGKTGFVIKRPKKFSYMSIKEEERELIKKLIEKASLLIENKNLREKMSKNCLKEIKEGKFSIKTRNKKLERIYGEALK